MRIKQGATIAIIGCVIWIVILIFSILGHISAILNARSEEFLLQTFIPTIIRTILSIAIAVSFLIFFISKHMEKRNKSISLFAITASIVWIILDISLIVTNTINQFALSFMPALTYIGIIANLLNLATSIAFLVFFIIDYTNYNKDVDKQTNTEIAITTAIGGSAMWTIVQILILTQNYFIYSEYGIPLTGLLYTVISLATPICFLIAFSMQLVGRKKK